MTFLNDAPVFNKFYILSCLSTNDIFTHDKHVSGRMAEETIWFRHVSCVTHTHTSISRLACVRHTSKQPSKWSSVSCDAGKIQAACKQPLSSMLLKSGLMQVGLHGVSGYEAHLWKVYLYTRMLGCRSHAV